MYEILTAARRLEYIGANRKRRRFPVIVAQNTAHGNACDAFSGNRAFRYDKAAVDIRLLTVGDIDFVALPDFIPSVKKAVV